MDNDKPLSEIMENARRAQIDHAQRHDVQLDFETEHVKSVEDVDEPQWASQDELEARRRADEEQVWEDWWNAQE